MHDHTTGEPENVALLLVVGFMGEIKQDRRRLSCLQQGRIAL